METLEINEGDFPYRRLSLATSSSSSRQNWGNVITTPAVKGTIQLGITRKSITRGLVMNQEYTNLISSLYLILGLGFITSIAFIFLVGVFMSLWLGTSVLSLGESFIKRMPFVRHIYNASKQIGSAISPDQNTQAFKEVAIIRDPRIGEYVSVFITSWITL